MQFGIEPDESHVIIIAVDAFKEVPFLQEIHLDGARSTLVGKTYV